MTKEFSVLLPIYNREKLRHTFPQCLASIAKNTILPDEVLIVSDGPLEWDIYEQVSFFENQLNIRIFQLKRNLGLSKALNIGLQECFYDIVARVDADDFCAPTRFEKQLKLIDDGFNLIGSNIQEIDEDGNSLQIRRVPEDQESIKRFALRRNPFNHMTMMYDRKEVYAVGGYPNFYLKEDYALWIMLLSRKSVRAFNLQENLMEATAGREMYSRRTSWRIMVQELQMQFFLRKYLKKSIILLTLDIIIRCSFYFIPLSLKSFVYRRFLRKL